MSQSLTTRRPTSLRDRRGRQPVGRLARGARPSPGPRCPRSRSSVLRRYSVRDNPTRWLRRRSRLGVVERTSHDSTALPEWHHRRVLLDLYRSVEPERCCLGGSLEDALPISMVGVEQQHADRVDRVLREIPYANDASVDEHYGGHVAPSVDHRLVEDRVEESASILVAHRVRIEHRQQVDRGTIRFDRRHLVECSRRHEQRISEVCNRSGDHGIAQSVEGVIDSPGRQPSPPDQVCPAESGQSSGPISFRRPRWNRPRSRRRRARLHP